MGFFHLILLYFARFQLFSDTSLSIYQIISLLLDLMRLPAFTETTACHIIYLSIYLLFFRFPMRCTWSTLGSDRSLLHTFCGIVYLTYFSVHNSVDFFLHFHYLFWRSSNFMCLGTIKSIHMFNSWLWTVVKFSCINCT